MLALMVMHTAGAYSCSLLLSYCTHSPAMLCQPAPEHTAALLTVSPPAPSRRAAHYDHMQETQAETCAKNNIRNNILAHCLRYADFTDCLEEHKGHAMFGEWSVAQGINDHPFSCSVHTWPCALRKRVVLQGCAEPTEQQRGKFVCACAAHTLAVCKGGLLVAANRKNVHISPCRCGAQASQLSPFP